MSDTLQRTPYEALGGEAGVRRLVNAFYDAVESDPAAERLRAMHSTDLSLIRRRLADWLSGWLGGPAVYAQRHPGRPCIMSAHARFEIGAEEAAQWMACMRKAMDQVHAPEDWRERMDTAFHRMCEGMRTH